MRWQPQPGDLIVYHKRKLSAHPGPRAADVDPAPRGEHYSYYVDKYWIVVHVLSGGKLVTRTRRGKRHTLEIDDPALRRASWWERLLLRNRFPSVDDIPAGAAVAK